MITINKQTQHEIEKLNLHDAEIRDVICNYYEHKVSIPIKLNTNKNELIFDEVLFIDVSLYEPWGAGMYINEFVIRESSELITKYSPLQDSQALHFTILLNSGDNINIVASKVAYK
ncbi:hypothetical protein [Paenibacillus monticola]|uniref:Uncharacterized protein n=1 Tax=Paenibacillus monticola TaxID=2666075 RepID=A0A7X2H4Y8_9BACL|nr:hypothetical protein [Paenibacillus monticola]MRN53614.1 hypothetical protein [Paenibacillus monticola]